MCEWNTFIQNLCFVVTDRIVLIHNCSWVSPYNDEINVDGMKRLKAQAIELLGSAKF